MTSNGPFLGELGSRALLLLKSSADGYGASLVDGLLVNNGLIAGGAGGGTHGAAYAGHGTQIDGGVVTNAGTITNSSTQAGAVAVAFGPRNAVRRLLRPVLRVRRRMGGGRHYTGFDGGQTIAGFAPGDTLVLNGFAATGERFVTGTGPELFSCAGTITLGIQGNYAAGDFVMTDPSAVTTITMESLALPCFAAGTGILAMRGAVAVEALHESDLVVLEDRGSAPVTWIGHRHLDTTRHQRPETVLPVPIEAGAIAAGRPWRDLYLSPDHALCLDGHLIPAKALLNGASIRQVAWPRATYDHVELPAHAALLAEVTPCGSDLDTGDRDAFQNGGAKVVPTPDFAQTRREGEGCGPSARPGRRSSASARGCWHGPGATGREPHDDGAGSPDQAAAGRCGDHPLAQRDPGPCSARSAPLPVPRRHDRRAVHRRHAGPAGPPRR